MKAHHKATLATEAQPNQLERLIEDDAWWLQQKLDGIRVLVQIDHKRVRYLNRGGVPLTRSIPRSIDTALDTIRQAFKKGETTILDGELMGDGLWLFDLPHAQDSEYHMNGTLHTYSLRLGMLEAFMGGIDVPPVRILPTAETTEDKRRLVDTVLEGGGEGIIARRCYGRVSPGRRSRDLLKIKFTKTCDCIVYRLGEGGKQNASVGLFRPGTKDFIEVGKFSTVGRPPTPVGTVVELRYLYASTEGRLVQPRMVRIRTDKNPWECTTDQLVPTDRTVLNLVPTTEDQ
jgi:ATP-dependent DNA ligase